MPDQHFSVYIGLIVIVENIIKFMTLIYEISLYIYFCEILLYIFKSYVFLSYIIFFW